MIDESVLTRTVGSPEVMQAQLHHLVELSDDPNITIEVVPMTAGAYCGLAGPLAVADVEGAGEIAYLDTVTDGYIEERAAVVARVVLFFNTLRSEALPRASSRDLITRQAEGYGSD